MGDPGGLAGWTGCFPGRPREQLQPPHHQAHAPAPEESVGGSLEGRGLSRLGPGSRKELQGRRDMLCLVPRRTACGCEPSLCCPQSDKHLPPLRCCHPGNFSVYRTSRQVWGTERHPRAVLRGSAGQPLQRRAKQKMEICRCGERSLNRNMLNSFLFIS